MHHKPGEGNLFVELEAAEGLLREHGRVSKAPHQIGISLALTVLFGAEHRLWN